MSQLPKTATWLAGLLLVMFGAALITLGVVQRVAPANAMFSADTR
jgi:hypothetical protein